MSCPAAGRLFLIKAFVVIWNLIKVTTQLLASQQRGDPMAVKISYDADNRLQFAGIECDCGSDHQLPDQDIYVVTGLI